MSEAAQWDHDLPSVSKVVSLSSEWWSMNMSNQVLRWGRPVLYVLDVSVRQQTLLKWSGHYEAWYDAAQLEHDVLVVADTASTSPRWCTIKIRPCAVWIRDMTSGFSDYFGPDSSADGSLCISIVFILLLLSSYSPASSNCCHECCNLFCCYSRAVFISGKAAHLCAAGMFWLVIMCERMLYIQV